MKQKAFIMMLCLPCLFLTMSCAGGDDDHEKEEPKVINTNANNAALQPELARLEFPHVKGGTSIVVIHNAILNSRTGERGVNYSTEWDTQKRAQRWSCYQMYESIKEGNTTRYTGDRTGSISAASQYPNDEFLSTEYVFSQDPYRGSGYDHGHICPSADRLGSAEANRQTFFLTNMQPQVNGFNAGVWENMESMLRTWNRTDFRDTLYVCKGGTIDADSTISSYIGSGQDRIPVPKYFFMAVLCKNTLGYKAMAFWIEHKAAITDGNDLKQYVISIDELEEKTGIDFFCNLPDDVEEKVEKEVHLNTWGFK